MTSPPDPTLMEDLIARLEKATGPDRVLDFELHISIVADEIWPATDMRGWVTNPNARMSDYLATYRDVINADDQDFDFPRYTASLDAALALVERVLPDSEYRIAGGPETGDTEAWARGSITTLNWPAKRTYKSEAYTPGIAILIALLKAIPQ